jgi:outer membrane protein assembly factor BamA
MKVGNKSLLYIYVLILNFIKTPTLFMSLQKLIFVFSFCFCLFPSFVSAQTSDFILIEKITVIGRKKTKESVVFRELDFKVGDTLRSTIIQERFRQNKEMLMNTSLFRTAEINIGAWDYDSHKVEIIVTLNENWYIYPYAYATLGDRNFNVWWYEKKHDLRRLNYNFGLSWNNLRGHRDILKLNAELGLQRRIDIDYKIPGINRSRTLGFYFKGLYSQAKEVWYITKNDKIQFIQEGKDSGLKRINATVGLSYRPQLRYWHALQLSYYNNTISDKVAQTENLDFFLNAKHQQLFFSLSYKFTQDWRNNKFYPEKGHFLSLMLEKEGVFSKKESVQALYSTLLFAKFVPIINKKITYEAILKVRKELTGNRQPYYNSRALGYANDYLRGFEYYVADGTAYAYLKNSIRILLYDKEIKFKEAYIPTAFRSNPIKIWFTINNDLGYAQNKFNLPSNQLPNRLLWGRGIGLNIMTLQTTYFQLEISQNYFNKIGFFLHAKRALE